MTKILAGLNRARGLEIESILDHESISNLAYFVLENFFKKEDEEHKPRQHTVYIDNGNLFGHKATNEVGLSVNPELRRIRINDTPVTGHVIISNIGDKAALRLHAELNDDLYEKETALLKIAAIGQLVVSKKVSLQKEYEPIIPSLKLDDVYIYTEFQPDGQVKLITAVEFIP